MKTILITGANRGLGQAFCTLYLNNKDTVWAGCRDLKNAESLHALQKQFPDTLHLFSLDVTESDSITHASEALSNVSIDILINNAGVYGDDATSPEMSTWISCFKTNAIGPYIMAQAFKQNLERGTDKKLINISSYMASITLNDNHLNPAYRASKTALNSLTKTLSNEFTPNDIIVAAIDPGWVRTDMGGPEGFLSATESSAAISNVISTLTINKAGKFLNYDGTEVPW